MSFQQSPRPRCNSWKKAAQIKDMAAKIGNWKRKDETDETVIYALSLRVGCQDCTLRLLYRYSIETISMRSSRKLLRLFLTVSSSASILILTPWDVSQRCHIGEVSTIWAELLTVKNALVRKHALRYRYFTWKYFPFHSFWRNANKKWGFAVNPVGCWQFSYPWNRKDLQS